MKNPNINLKNHSNTKNIQYITSVSSSRIQNTHRSIDASGVFPALSAAKGQNNKLTKTTTKTF